MRFMAYIPLRRALFVPGVRDFVKNLSKDLLASWEGDSGYKSALCEMLGFEPIQAFPADDYPMAYAHSMLSMPPEPDVCVVFDTNDYVMLDRVRHLGLMRQPGLTPELEAAYVRSAIVRDCPTRAHMEALVSQEAVESGWRAAFILFTAAELCDDGLDPRDIPVFVNSPGTGAGVCTVSSDIFRMSKEFMPGVFGEIVSSLKTGSGAIPGMSPEDAAYCAESERTKMLFILLCLRVFMKAVEGRNYAPLDVLAGCTRIRRARNMADAFWKAVFDQDGLSAERYDRLFSKVKSCVIDTSAILEYMESHDGELPSFGDPCPCGSGLAYGKCCGHAFFAAGV